MTRKYLCFLFALVPTCSAFAQATHSIIDEEKDYKAAKEFIAKEQYAFAYPLLKELKQQYPANRKADHAYINDDLDYYNALCELKLLQDIGREDGVEYIRSVSNEPRRQLMSFHLAHYYFLRNDFENAVSYFDMAGYENLSNEQIADAKFEKAYSLFNLKQICRCQAVIQRDTPAACQ